MEEFELDDELEDYEYYEVEDDDLNLSDYMFIGGGIIIFCGVLAFIFKQIRKTFKNIHVKLGDKVEVGVETKK